MRTKAKSPILRGMKLCHEENQLEIALHYLLELFLSHPLACASEHTLPEGTDPFVYLTPAQVKLTSQLSYSLRTYVSVNNHIN